MSILSLALQRRWLGWLGLTALFAVVCVGLAQWQWQRRLEAVAEIRVVAANWDAAPVPLTEALPETDVLDPDLEWQPVELVGEYLVDEQLLVRARPLNGRPGFEVLTPLLLDDGTVFVVDRGWLPVGSEQDSPDVVPAPPSGRVEVLARLKPGEPELRGRGAPEGQIATIHLPDVAQRVEAGAVMTGAYGLLDSESPAPDTRPVAATRPVPDEGPHLSYTFQWYLFGLMGFIGYGWALRKERQRIVAEETGEPTPQRVRARASDADEEDALLGHR
ncbi:MULTISPECIES: SURF1 family protein [unclassified Microcella]|uniref:SURF1 family cytochrome oxidase biogenesis protein n=1 Tax=unclassified Microcella TaxID=2630066 RepID=UPI0006FCAEDB|nr:MULTISPECIES: SURF1 family protein [unclassified Microcella]KQV25054.1 sortase [Yonghaparkia sp. Root332]KRF31340.1 sortase [Yonghaparkia sp. Soil809]